MKTFRFSIKGLLIAVAVIAVGLFALFNASYVWSSVFFLTTLLLLLTAVFALVFGHGEARSFWAGVVVFGWVYFTLTNPPLANSYLPLLPTHLALETLFGSVEREVSFDSSDGAKQYSSVRVRSTGTGGSKYFVTLPDKLYFHRIGQCLWTWLFALTGGFLARYFYLLREREKTRGK